MAGSLKLTREQLALITGGDPRAIKAFEDFFLAINNLGQHHTTHEPGGSDPLTVDAIPGVGSLRTLGTGAQKAAAGIHAATHLIGGGDAIAFAPYVDTAANLAAANPVLAVGQLGWESDTLSGKIGDGTTAYNTLTYFYRGLPVAGEPSLGTPHPKAGQQVAWFVNGATPGAGVWLTVTFTVTAGTKAVIAAFGMVNGTSSEYLRWRPYNNGDTWAQSFHRVLVGSLAAGTNPVAQAIVPIDSSGRVDVAIGNAGAHSIYVGYPQLYGI